MRECWETEPDNRPTFDKLCQKIRLLGARANQVKNIFIYVVYTGDTSASH